MHANAPHIVLLNSICVRNAIEVLYTVIHYTVFQLDWEKGRVQKKLGTI